METVERHYNQYRLLTPPNTMSSPAAKTDAAKASNDDVGMEIPRSESPPVILATSNEPTTQAREDDAASRSEDNLTVNHQSLLDSAVSTLADTERCSKHNVNIAEIDTRRSSDIPNSAPRRDSQIDDVVPAAHTQSSHMPTQNNLGEPDNDSEIDSIPKALAPEKARLHQPPVHASTIQESPVHWSNSSHRETRGNFTAPQNLGSHQSLPPTQGYRASRSDSSAKTMDTITTDDGLPRLPPSPAWSSDSDNRLIKAVTSGKTSESLFREFPSRRSEDVERRRGILTADGVFGDTQQQMTPETPADGTPPGQFSKGPKNWAAAEDEIVVAGVKAGDTTKVISQRIAGRSDGAVSKRMYRLVELNRITEQERQVVLNAAYGPDYTYPAKWQPSEDRILIGAIQRGKTVAQTADLLSIRTEDSCRRRRQALIELGQLGRTASFGQAQGPLATTPDAGLVANGAKTSRSTLWTIEEDNLLRSLASQGDPDWKYISTHFASRSTSAVHNRWIGLVKSNKTKIQPTNAPSRSTSQPRIATSTTRTAGLPWSEDEDRLLLQLVREGKRWTDMGGLFGTRSVGSFQNRYKALVTKGKTNEPQRYSSSSAFSGDDADDGPPLRKSARRALGHTKRTPSQAGFSNGAGNNGDDMPRKKRTVGSLTQIARKTVNPVRPVPKVDPDHSDTDSDDDARSYLPARPVGTKVSTSTTVSTRSKSGSSTYRSKGGSITRSASRTVAHSRSRVTTSSHFQQEHGATDSRNSVDRLSEPVALVDHDDDDDTIHVAAGAQHKGTKESRKSGGVTRSLDVDNGLDEALADTDAEIKALKARLAQAKLERLEQMREQIRQLKAQLAEYGPVT